MAQDEQSIPPILVDIPAAAAALSVSVATMWRLVNNREVESVRLGRRVLIPVAELHALVDEARRRHHNPSDAA